MIINDVFRAALYVSIPLNLAFGLVNELTWIYVVQFLASSASLFWTPAKDASIPNLVPPDKLEQANQYSLFTTFGTAPVAGLIFALLAGVSRALGSDQVNLALYFNAATFVVSALTIYALKEIPKRQASAHISAPSVAKTIWEGWKFLGQTPVVRGLVIGMVGAFAAGGVVIGLGPSYIKNTLDGGSAGWGAVFTAIFVGLAAGMFLGLRILRGFSRRRLFGLSIVGAGVPLVLIGLIPNLVIVVLLVILLGAFAGIAYVTGYTIVGTEVDDETRGRTFAFLQSGIRVILFTVIAVAPFIAAGFTALVHSTTGGSTLRIAHIDYDAVGYNFVLLLSAVIAVWLGVVSYQQMDDRRGVPLRADLIAALRGEPFVPVPGHPNGTAPQPDAAPRPADRVRGRGGGGQDHSGPAARHLAPRAGLRRDRHPGARRDQGGDAAARPVAGHRAYRPLPARRDPDVRGGPRRARRFGDSPRAGTGHGCRDRSLCRLVNCLPGARTSAAGRRSSGAEQMGHRGPGAGPDHPA